MNQKGASALVLLLGIIILVGIVGGSYYLGTKKVVVPQPQTQNPTVISQTPQPDITPLPSSGPLQTDKIYLVNKLSGNETVLMDTPKNAEVKSQNETGYIVSQVKVDNSLYSVAPQGGGHGGPCPMEDFGTKCGYTDEQVDIKLPLEIGAVRIWKDEKGIFLINPQSIQLGNTYINNILITKLQPNTVFTTEEVNMWKQLLTTIELH